MATTAEKLKAAEEAISKLEQDLSESNELFGNATSHIGELRNEITSKDEKILELETVIANMSNASVQPEFAELSASIINRDSLRLAFASGGQLRKEHAYSDAQQIDRAIDEVLKVWGSNS